jgi:hypothetical protein
MATDKIKTSSDDVPQKFQSWLAFDKNALQTGLRYEEFEPKVWEEADIDIRVTHCGVCASDLHTVRSGWVSSQSMKFDFRPPSLPNHFFDIKNLHRALPCILAALVTNSLEKSSAWETWFSGA